MGKRTAQISAAQEPNIRLFLCECFRDNELLRIYREIRQKYLQKRSTARQLYSRFNTKILMQLIFKKVLAPPVPLPDLGAVENCIAYLIASFV